MGIAPRAGGVRLPYMFRTACVRPGFGGVRVWDA